MLKTSLKYHQVKWKNEDFPLVVKEKKKINKKSDFHPEK